MDAPPRFSLNHRVPGLADTLPPLLAAPASEALRAWVQRGEEGLAALWPELSLEPKSLAAALAERLPKDGDGLDGLDPAGLLLAAATLAGQSAAVACFDQVLRAEVRRAVSPLDTSNTLVDEVTQLARERLLVGSDGRPRLADYAGQGALAAWLRAVAVRLALNAKRPGAREEVVAQVPDTALADPDPELALLRSRHREQFKAAFAAAVAQLSPRERTLLRLTTLDGLTLAQAGKMYGKDASTVSRWLAAARATLLESTRRTLAETLRLGSGELDSVMRAADSELNLSISRLLRAADET